MYTREGDLEGANYCVAWFRSVATNKMGYTIRYDLLPADFQDCSVINSSLRCPLPVGI